MQSKSLLVLLSALALSSASPLRRRCGNDTLPTPTNPLPTRPGVTVPVLPTTGTSNELQGPPENATLKHILVGHGIQNYTCGAAGSKAAAIGALAVVWEITDLYPGMSPSSLSAADFADLPSKVLRTTPMPLNMAPATGNSSSAATWTRGAVVAAPFPAPADLAIRDVAAPVRFVGHHFFDATNTPTFDLSAAGERFSGKKDGDVAAPPGSDPGVDPATGAADWLRLGDKGGSTGGVQLVFRVRTAGGNAEPCGAAGEAQSIPYAAQYWVYGSA
ncbi:hypothetical protein GGR52DRAFT_306608 [Hypoxylon sp. FL1284]|nr:hypothetical protein GGR52DRAFT_306608 [Hypoxylon sp. FL1284]